MGLTNREKHVIYGIFRKKIYSIDVDNIDIKRTKWDIAGDYQDMFPLADESPYFNNEPEILSFIEENILAFIKGLSKIEKTEKNILKDILKNQKKCLEMAYEKNDPKTASTILKEIERLKKELMAFETTSQNAFTKNRRILEQLELLEKKIPGEHFRGLND